MKFQRGLEQLCRFACLPLGLKNKRKNGSSQAQGLLEGAASAELAQQEGDTMAKSLSRVVLVLVVLALWEHSTLWLFTSTATGAHRIPQALRRGRSSAQPRNIEVTTVYYGMQTEERNFKGRVSRREQKRLRAKRRNGRDIIEFSLQEATWTLQFVSGLKAARGTQTRTTENTILREVRLMFICFASG